MNLQTSNKREDEIDQREGQKLNPIARDLQNREHEATSGYNSSGDGLDDHPISAGSAEGVEPSSSKNIDKVRSQEEKSIPYTNTGTRKSRGSALQRVKLWGKKKVAAGTLVTVLTAGGLSIPFLSGGLAPFMLVESLTDDLADKVPAFQFRGKLITVKRFLPRTSSSEAVKGCTTLSIRCKFKTIGSKQKARLAKAGIEVKGKSVIGGRTVPETYSFRSQNMSPPEFEKALRTNSDLARAHYRANNAKFLAYQGSFVNRVLARYGLAKQPKAGVKGSKADRLNQMLTKAGTDDPSSLRMQTGENADGKKTYKLVDSNGNIVEDYGTNSSKASKAQQAIDAAKPTKTPTPGVKKMIGALGVLGSYDMACTVNNMVGAGTVAAKIAANQDLVDYSWELFSLVHKIKSGDGTAEDYELIGTLLSDTDTRKEIVDLTATAKEAQKDSSFDGEILKNNPEFGKNAMDSELVKMSINGGVAPLTESQNKASLGFDARTLLKGFGAVSETLDTMINLGDTNACYYVQHWATRFVSIGAAVVLAITSGGGSAVGQAAVIGGMAVAMYSLQKAINASVSGSVTDYLASGDEKVARGDFAWTGHASAQSSAAQSVGMIPGNAKEMVAYRNDVVSESYSQIASLEGGDANPLDVKNQYSFLGSLARNIYKDTSQNSSVISNLASLPSLTLNSLSGSVYAADEDIERYKRCKDKDLLDIGIEADVQCNVRYYMPRELLELDPEEVALWMENEGCGGSGCVEKNTETGLPPGYTPPDARESQNGLTQFLKDSSIGMFKKTDTDLVNSYGEFLEYCALRTVPYGKTYKESGLFGEAGEEWQTGEKCRERSKQIDYFRVYTMDVALLEDEEYEQETVADEIEGGSEFRASSFNVYGANHTDGDFEARMDKSIDVITSNNIDIVGMQEFTSNQQDYFLNKMTSFDMYPAKNDDRSPNAIVWDSDRFTRVDAGLMPDLKYFGAMKLEAPWLILKDNDTEQEFYVLNTHDPAKPENSEKRVYNANKHVEFISKIKSKGIPIVFTGDFNGSSVVNTEGNITLNKDPNNLTYCILNNSKLVKDAYDIANDIKYTCPNPKGNKSPDHIYVSDGIEVTDYLKVPKGTNGSDVHDTHIADIIIPGSEYSAEKFTAATYNIMHMQYRKKCKSDESLVNCTKRRTEDQAGIIDGSHPGAGDPYDIVGFQEISPLQYSTLKNKLPDYGYYPAYVPNNRGLAVMWNKNKFNFIKGGSISTIDNAGDPNRTPWVQLKTGDTNIFVMSIHSPNNHSGGANARAKRITNARTYRDWMKSKTNDKSLAIVMGDFNRNFVDNGIAPTQRAYCIMTDSPKVQNLYDMSLGKDPANPCPSKTNGSTGIDHLYITPNSGVTAENWKREPSSGVYRSSSDHEPVRVDIKLPVGSASGEVAWPLDKSYWNKHRNDFLDAHTAFSGTWTSGVGRLAVDISAPPDGSPVYAMLGGKVSKSDLGGHGLAIKSEIQGGTLEIAYAHGPRTNRNSSYKTGDQIMKIGALGNVTGGHLHIDMAFNGKGVCPQDVFLAIDKGQVPNFDQLTKKAAPGCYGRDQ